MYEHLKKLAKFFFRGCIHVPRFNRGGSENGERAGVERRKERGKGKGRRHDGRKGEEGRHGEFGWGGGDCATAPGDRRHWGQVGGSQKFGNAWAPFLEMGASGVARILCQGAQVWRCKKTENNECISYHPRRQPILPSMRHCIRPVCHSHTVYNNKMKLNMKV